LKIGHVLLAECIPQGSLVSNDTFKIFIVVMLIWYLLDYLAGRKSGFYWPSLPPTYKEK
jgi:hypothetical protein